MRLGFVIHKVLKGEGHSMVAYEIVKAALQAGHHVTLIASEVADDLQAHPELRWVNIESTRWPTQLVRCQVFAWKTARWLRAHAHTFDVLQVNGFSTWAAGDISASHFVHSAWKQSPVHTWRLRKDVYGLYQWIYTSLNAVLEKRAYRQARAVVAVSERVKAELVAAGISSTQIQVILNGVDLVEFRPGAQDRDKLGLPSGVPLALFAGDIRTPRKNLDTVLHALVQTPSVHLAILGKTEGSPYPALAKQLGIEDRAHFLGYRRDIAEVMRTADLFVFPSRYEACSLVLLEALASGLPVITARTTGGAEVVTADCGVVLPDPNSIVDLVTAMRAMTEDPARATAMGVAARSVAEEYSWARMADHYLMLYREMNQGPQSRRIMRSEAHAARKAVGAE